MNTQTTTNLKIPAIDITLSNKHLIEASAGTGKTWTLTGIVLRLLIEKKTPPEQIICTTFTRAAAAEMRQRIHERLTDFYHLLNWLIEVSAHTENHSWLYPKTDDLSDTHDDKEVSTAKKNELKTKRHNQRENQLLELAKNRQSIKKLLEDKVNMHLVNYLTDRVASYPLAEAIRRTTSLMTTLDKLFVSTLDSLAQKWLSEYSAETGFRKGMSICDDEHAVIDSIIHDEIRAFQSHVYHNNPALYQTLQQGGYLTGVGDHKNASNTAMTFINLPIDEVDVKDFDFSGLRRFLTRFNEHDYTDVLPYFEANFRKKQCMNGRTNLAKKINEIPQIIQMIQKYGLEYDANIDKNASGFIKALQEFINEDKGFTDKADKQPSVFASLPTIDLLICLLDYQDQLANHINATLASLNRQIALKVRQRLPIILEERNQTTFSLQMVRLNQALKGTQGKKLAKYIRHQYPVALIDESQDINGEQAEMIKQIYLTANSKQEQEKEDKSNRGFLLLVGDPKQAIYGFRGGDVANYNAVKTLFQPKQIHTLNQNFRSSQALIHSLNHWFGAVSADEVDEKFAQLGQGICYNHITANQTDSNLQWQGLELAPTQPVSVIHLPYNNEDGDDEITIVAQHIASLIHSNARLNDKPLTASDFAILGKSKDLLNKAQKALHKLNIATVKVADKNIFDTRMASDLLAVLQAVLNPFHHGFINRALTSSWYGFSLAAVKTMQRINDEGDEGSDEGSEKEGIYAVEDVEDVEDQKNKQAYSDFQQFCKTASELWANKGILTAVEYLLSGNNPLTSPLTSPLTTQSVWENLASNNNPSHAERNLIDLRQLLDILAQHCSSLGEYETISWLSKHLANAKTTSPAEWAIQHPVPTQSGVQLMTIHKSKGLEFPIVYVLGMGQAFSNVKKANALYLTSDNEDDNNNNHHNKNHNSNNNNNNRKLTTADDERVIASVEEAAFAELKRLIYVALTRASEQVFIPLKDPYNKTDIIKKPTHFWLECADKDYTLPERLQNHIGWQQGQDIGNYFADNEIGRRLSNPNDSSANALNQADGKQKQLIDYPNYDAVIKRKRFIGWAKTSFTALAHNLHSEVADTAINEADYDSIEQALLDKEGFTQTAELDTTKTSTEKSVEQNQIRFEFVKGANAGSFLHKIFEIMDFNDDTTWSESIDKCVVEFDLPDVYGSTKIQKQRIEGRYGRDKNGKLLKEVDEKSLNQDTHEQLKNWIGEVLKSPLTASNVSLKDIEANKRLPELGFSMKLGDGFSVSKISEIFAKHLGKDDDRYVHLASSAGQNIYRYLRGEIDLVYQHNGKFYVVDYKSNHLGNSTEEYNQTNLAKAMSKAGYWLQAMIYQVALHRLLKLRVPDYIGNEATYLGAVEYLFVRGCVADLDKTEYGKISWDIPVDMVLEMDQVFGY